MLQRSYLVTLFYFIFFIVSLDEAYPGEPINVVTNHYVWETYDDDQDSQARQSPTIDETMDEQREPIDWDSPSSRNISKNDVYGPQQIVPSQTLLQEWNDNNPTRFDAYQKAVQSGNQQFFYEHTISFQVRTLLQKNGIDYKKYARLQGNTLQHGLLNEIIAGLEKTACARPIDQFYNVLITQSVSLFEEACICNQCGDCVASSKLIDFASSLIDCCFAALQGATKGIIQGTTDAITGTYHLIAHPLQSTQNIGQAAVQLTKLIHEYLPTLNLVEFAASEDGYQRYHHKLLRTHQNWQQLRTKLKQCWQRPTADLIRDISESVAHTATNIIVGNACIGFLTRVSMVAVEEIRALQQSKVLATAGEDLPQFFTNMTEMDQAKMPATTFLNKNCAYEKLIQYGEKYGYSQEQTIVALKILEQEMGNVEKLSLALEKLEKIPGATKSIKLALNSKNLGNLRGGCFELESTLKALDRGEEIIAMGLEITGPGFKREIDIVTKTKFIECKNWNWGSYNPQHQANKIEELKGLLIKKNDAAKLFNKTLVLHSKHHFPLIDEFSDLKKWLENQNIVLIEG